MNMVQMSKLTDKRMKSIFCTYVVMKGSIILAVIKAVWDGSGQWDVLQESLRKRAAEKSG